MESVSEDCCFNDYFEGCSLWKAQKPKPETTEKNPNI